MRIVTLFLLLVLPVLLSAQEIMYEEYFSDGTLDNPWYAGYNVNGGGKILQPKSVSDNPSGDGWVGWMTTWREADTGNVAQSWSGNMDWTDYTYEANVYFPMESKAGAMFVEYYALEFRIDTSGNTSAYQFMATLDTSAFLSPRLRFRKRPTESPSSPITLMEWLADSIPGGLPVSPGWQKMAVKVKGNDFWFYFNDQELPGCPYQDTTTTTVHLNKGPIGVYVFKLNFGGDITDTTYVYVDDIVVKSVPTAIEDENRVVRPESFTLQQNYPNPFNPTTTIRFVLRESGPVTLTVFDIMGKAVCTLIDGKQSAGEKTITWDATDNTGKQVAPGVYFYKLNTKQGSQTRKMILLK